MKIAILFPYGIFQESNRQYKDYIDRSYDILVSTKFDYLLLSGGCTNKDFPNLSEAKSIYNYLIQKDAGLEKQILLEESSFTTLGNLEHLFEVLKNKNIPADQIIITCDSIRLIKVFVLAISLFDQNTSEEEILESLLIQGIENNIKLTQDSVLKFKGITIQGLNIHRTIDEVAVQISSTLLEANFLKYPKLHQKTIQWKKKIWGIK